MSKEGVVGGDGPFNNTLYAVPVLEAYLNRTYNRTVLDRVERLAAIRARRADTTILSEAV